MSESPIVTVCVQTYQHGKYIKECLDGLIKQRTIFPFEIIIGEDGSDDGTREICKEYTALYPDLIKLLLRNREDVIYINNRPTGRYNFIKTLEAAKGKYIALCEGDDYWVDPFKLQKQFDFMESHTECSFCFHDGYIVDENSLIRSKQTLNWSQDTVPADQLISGGGSIILTPSYFFKRKALSIPSFLRDSPVADFFLMLLLLMKGQSGYIPEIMCAYRKNTAGGWSSGYRSSWEKYYQFYTSFNKSLNDFNEYSGNIFVKELEALNVKRHYALVSNFYRFHKNRVERLKFLLKNSGYLNWNDRIKLFAKGLL